MNGTELRLMLFRATGKRVPRHIPDSELTSLDMDAATGICAQSYKRQRMSDWLQANWTYVQESLNCEGDCASVHNRCTDLQAHLCYQENREKVDPR